MWHNLKCWPNGYDDIQRGSKTFEVRFADREFTVGDTLLLREWLPDTAEYTGREQEVDVTYIYHGDTPSAPVSIFGCRPDEEHTALPIVVMGIKHHQEEIDVQNESARNPVEAYA